MSKKICLFAILLLMLPVAQATNLGTVVKQSALTAMLGESVKFTILFWNAEEDTYKVVLSVEEAPEGWDVFVKPEEFLLDATTGTERILIGDRTVKAVPVEVFVRPTTVGNHTILLKAVAGTPTGQISFLQERIFTLKLSVLGPEEQTHAVGAPSATKIQQPQATLPASPKKNLEYLLYLLVFVCILVLSLLIYKYA